MLSEENTRNIQMWIQYAKSDLDLARIDVPKTVLPEILCFRAQQAVEKAHQSIHRLLEFGPTHMDFKVHL